ncbi:ribonuclease P protein component [bacterium]|nr:MAG: ribonuclease P protein component [bacterium]
MTGRDRRPWRSLRHRSEFQKVYEHGVKKVGRLLVVYLLQADDTARAVVASRKVGGAVQRNRAKRLLREARLLGVLGDRDGVRSVSARFFPETGTQTSSRSAEERLWIVLVARHAILGASSREVQQELDRLLGEDAPAAAPLEHSRDAAHR